MRRFDALSPNLQGACWMLTAALTFTIMTTLVKFLGNDYPAGLQTFYRQAAGVIVLLPLMARDWRRAFYTTRPGILLFRSAAGTLATILSFYAYQALPLADANALSFTRSLWLVPLAAFVLREKIGFPRVIAALAGFAGVVLLVSGMGGGGTGNATGMALLWGQGAALASALLFALTITGMKVMVRDHAPLVLLVYAALLGLAFSIPPAIFVWRWPGLLDLALLAIMGAFGVITQACYIKGMAVGDAAAMAPIDYTRLVFAVIAGFVLFGDIPAWTTIAGALIVVGSTLYITWSEQRASNRLARAAASQAHS
ncbi:MAG: DMT family transporter [Parvibaculaceae bacterium]|nr:DMT family transporter [Parvibaculaceae bacterium]